MEKYGLRMKSSTGNTADIFIDCFLEIKFLCVRRRLAGAAHSELQLQRFICASAAVAYLQPRITVCSSVVAGAGHFTTASKYEKWYRRNKEDAVRIRKFTFLKIQM
ncbi:uncharacterized protein LOC118756250 [Rhagoletis pomonella]|uniref:uncharacterized protein LOC118756250 n=1 Tax=Rhagoletis pomonella TaxID=28610 RepID=UPI00177D2F85|nr:uncharacterized protein LOC118756250 [Rhagoletis pomonella]